MALLVDRQHWNVYIHFDTTSINGLRYRMLAATLGHGTVLSHPTNHLPPSLPPVSSLSPSSLSLTAWEHKLWYRTDTAQQKVTPVAASFFSSFLPFSHPAWPFPLSPHNSSSTLHTPHHSPHEKLKKKRKKKCGCRKPHILIVEARKLVNSGRV